MGTCRSLLFPFWFGHCLSMQIKCTGNCLSTAVFRICTYMPSRSQQTNKIPPPEREDNVCPQVMYVKIKSTIVQYRNKQVALDRLDSECSEPSHSSLIGTWNHQSLISIQILIPRGVGCMQPGLLTFLPAPGQGYCWLEDLTVSTLPLTHWEMLFHAFEK